MLHDDLFDRFTPSESFENALHRDASACDHRLTHHDVGFGFDQIHQPILAHDTLDSSSIYRPAGTCLGMVPFSSHIFFACGTGFPTVQ